MTPTLESSVLIVIDAQAGFVNDASAHAVPVIADLLRRWQEAGGASILTQFVNHPDSSYVRLIGWTALMPGTPEIDLVPEVARYAPTSTAVVSKTCYSALLPEVTDLISRNGWRDVWVAGLDTESCVLATMLGAFEGGLTPWLVTDAVASHAGTHVHDAGLLVIGRFVGGQQLITSKDAPIPATDSDHSRRAG
jgi:nicotinamidase-related amidase